MAATKAAHHRNAGSGWLDNGVCDFTVDSLCPISNFVVLPQQFCFVSSPSEQVIAAGIPCLYATAQNLTDQHGDFVVSSLSGEQASHFRPDGYGQR